MQLSFEPSNEEVVLSPDNLMVIGAPKLGKSTIMAMLPNHGILNIEPMGIDGYKYLKHVAVDMTPKTLDDFKQLVSQAHAFVKNNNGQKPYKFLVVDNMDVFDEWAEDEATADYMKSKQGKEFNRWTMQELREAKLTGKYKPGDLKPVKLWDSVLNMGKGYGYRWHRVAFKRLIEYLQFFAEKIVFVCHIRDKYLDKGGKETTVRVANLTGQLGSILAGICDSTCMLSRKGNKVLADFNVDDMSAGGRIPHLDGNVIELSEKRDDGSIAVYWGRIFPELGEEPFILTY